MQAGRLLPDDIRTVLLTGFMGAGKTTVGRLLAAQLGWEFRDLDHEIEREARLSVAEIFETCGEADFRRRETVALGRLLSREKVVIALGGGALETAPTRELLASDAHHVLVYLSAPLEILVQRCLDQSQSAVRPVLADRDRLQTRWISRLPFYEQAHLRIETNSLTPRQVAVSIAAAMTQRPTMSQSL